MKICRNCNTTKQLTEFPVRKDSKDGYRNICRDCKRVQHNSWREANQKHVRDKNREYRLNNKEKIQKYNKQWREDNKDKLRNADKIKRRKYRANTEVRAKESVRNKIGHAIRIGKMIRPDRCVLNNANCRGRIELHHDSYDNPLEVTALCQEHHKAWHRVFEAK